MEPTPLEIEVDKLIAWLEENTADLTDMREALTAAGIRLGKRCDLARQDELTAMRVLRKDALQNSGKTPVIAIIADIADIGAVEAKQVK